MNTKTDEQKNVEKLATEAAELAIKLWSKIFELKRAVAPTTYASTKDVSKEQLDKLVSESAGRLTVETLKQVLRAGHRVVDVNSIRMAVANVGVQELTQKALRENNPGFILELVSIQQETEEEHNDDIAIVCPCDKHQKRPIPASGLA